MSYKVKIRLPNLWLEITIDEEDSANFVFDALRHEAVKKGYEPPILEKGPNWFRIK